MNSQAFEMNIWFYDVDLAFLKAVMEKIQSQTIPTIISYFLKNISSSLRQNFSLNSLRIYKVIDSTLKNMKNLPILTHLNTSRVFKTLKCTFLKISLNSFSLFNFRLLQHGEKSS